MIDHVTYHVEPGTLDRADLTAFMLALGLQEESPNDKFEHGWKVRWFRGITVGFLGSAPQQTALHLVEGDNEEAGGEARADSDVLSLGHFCVSGVGSGRVAALRNTRWCVRDSGSGRIWLAFNNLRVEVRA